MSGIPELSAEQRKDRDEWDAELRALQRENQRLQGEVKEMERRLDLTRAARNVAVDKLIQIARVIRPDDYEDTEEEG